MKPIRAWILLAMMSTLLSGCAMTWNPDWQQGGSEPSAMTSRKLLDQARADFERAEDQASLRRAITSYQQVLTENPSDYEALTQLSTLTILEGTAFTDKRREKSELFRKAMRYAERAMYRNPQFRQRVDTGATPWEASSLLGADEVEAMFFWVTALQYEFKEGMSLPAKIVNVKWLQRALVFLERITEVTPDFGGGGVEFAKAICFYALPGAYGGSTELGDLWMAKAVEKGDSWLLPRWARGKYYYPIINEPELAHEELQWVAQQNLETFKDPYPWRVHFLENAREILQ
ncbi:MAG: hypothetical protein C0614_05590 [Desulfuromonas sp.]|nr:MAG: hypothetical protein C0614_05590 [Desulfuromonas sp.]